MDTLKEIRDAEFQLLKLYQSPWELGESNEDWNELQRAKIAALASQYGGKCVLGIVNIYQSTERVMWEYQNGEMVYNFGAAFAIPEFNQELHDLIVNRSNAPYTGTKDDSVLVDSIFNKIESLNGITLLWT